MASEPEDHIQLRINYEVPENVPTRYATHIVAQHGDREFLISFFEVWPPLLLGTPEEIQAQIEQTDHVKAKCVARIVVSADRLTEFIQVLQNNLQKFTAKQ